MDLKKNEEKSRKIKVEKHQQQKLNYEEVLYCHFPKVWVLFSDEFFFIPLRSVISLVDFPHVGWEDEANVKYKYIFLYLNFKYIKEEKLHLRGHLAFFTRTKLLLFFFIFYFYVKGKFTIWKYLTCSKYNVTHDI